MGAARDTLHALLKDRRADLIARWTAQIKDVTGMESLSHTELLDQLPSFLDEIMAALYPDAVPFPVESGSAEEHGVQRLRLGFDVGQVVREYALLHECIIALAKSANVTVEPREHEIITRWLNVGIADAVAQYVKQRDVELQRQTAEHMGFIAHELRNPLAAARVAFGRLRTPGLDSASRSRAMDVLDRNLRRTADMIDNVLSEASLRMGVDPQSSRLHVRRLLEDVVLESSFEAEARNIRAAVSAPNDLELDGDARLLRSAVSNLVHNAIKFSSAGSTIAVTAVAADGRVGIEVADACGGLPPGKAEELFSPLVQRGENRSGFGLGLAIALQAAEAHHGTITVHDVPGTGCVFRIDLPGGAHEPRK